MKRGAKWKKEQNAKKMEIKERRAIVAANILAGSSYREIAEGLGVSPSTICKDFKAILDDWQKQSTEIIGNWIPLELGRLDRMTKAIWDDVKKGDLRAMDRMIKIMERRAKLLGLDAPSSANIKVELTFEEKTIQYIKAGEIGYKELAEEFDIDLATKLFQLAGVEVTEGQASD